MSEMTKGERDELQRILRQREKALIDEAKQRTAELLADFENQLASEFSFDDDAVWAEAMRRAQTEVSRAQAQIAKRCVELGIPARFAPTLNSNWYSRGENAAKDRRNELRRVARSRAEALEKAAIVEIRTLTVNAATEVALAGLKSEAARAFLENLPAVESLMPSLSYAELAGDAEPPVVEQLLSPNALRQRRYRERQKALRNATGPKALRVATGGEHDSEAAG